MILPAARGLTDFYTYEGDRGGEEEEGEEEEGRRRRTGQEKRGGKDEMTSVSNSCESVSIKVKDMKMPRIIEK